MQYEIVKVLKTDAETEAIVTAGVKAARPTQYIQNVLETEDSWLVRLAEFPFEKKDDEGADDAPSDEAPADDKPKDDSDDSDDKADDDKGDDKKKDKKDNKNDGEGDALGKLKTLIGEISSLFDELQNSTQEVSDKADEQAGAVEEIGGLLDVHRGPKSDAAELPGDIGPVPGGGDVGLGGPPVAPPTGPKPAKGLDKRKPGAPGISTFTHREFEYATHPGVDENGEKMTIFAAAQELASSEELQEFEVEALKADADGQYVAKLKRK